MQTMFPAEGLAQIIRSPDGHNGHGQETHSHNANGKQKARGFAGKGLKRLCSLGCGTDVASAGFKQRRRRGKNDEVHDQVGEHHADRNVSGGMVQILLGRA